MNSTLSSTVLALPGLRRPNKINGPFPLGHVDIETIDRAAIVQALDSAPRIWDNGGVKVVRVSQDVVVKYGQKVNICEANNMRFVSQHTSIRLPTLLDSWVEGEDGNYLDSGESTCYIVMQYIDGMLLDEVWSELSDALRRNIQQQLYEFLQQLHNLTSDSPGPIGGGVSNSSFFTDYGARPFSSNGDMERWFNERLAVCRDFGVADSTQPGFDGLFQCLVRCHMDLHLRNIVLDAQGNVWLIDWAYAGMCPAYFETASILIYGREVYFQHLLDELDYTKYSKETDSLFAISFALTTGAFCNPSRPISQSL